MATYLTLDQFPDLTAAAMSAAVTLDFTAITGGTGGWDYGAAVNGTAPNAAQRKLFRFTAIEGAVYELISTSYFDPVNLLVYDRDGNAVSANNEGDDPPDETYLDGGVYGLDATFSWRAPYSGTFYVDAGWNQGSRFSYYALTVREDRDAVNLVNQPPVVSSPVADREWVEGQSYQFVVPAGTFTDPDGQSLMLSVALPSGGSLPGWLSYNAATRTFSGSPPVGADDVTIRLRATDVWGLSVTDDFTILTAAPLNRVPVLNTPLADQSSTEGQAFEFTVPAIAFADPEGQPLTYSATLASGEPLPAWLTFNTGLRIFTGTPPVGSPDLTVRVRAADPAGLAASDEFQITTAAPPNRPPTVATPLLDQNWVEGRAADFTLPANTFTDPEGQSLTWSARLADGSALPAWLSFAAATRRFTGTPPTNAPDLTVRVTATDTAGAGAFDDVIFYTPATEGESGISFRGTLNGDVIAGTAGADTLYGSKGDDEVTGGAGNDTIDGGDDIDTAVYRGSLAEYKISYDEATQRYTVTDQRAGRDGVDTLTLVEFFKFADGVRAAGPSQGGTILAGTPQADTLTGGNGPEVLYGEQGDDTLDGGGGIDWMYGGPGNDRYVLSEAGDLVIELPGEGTDTVVAGFSFSLAPLPNVENLTASGSTGLTLTGNDAANVLRGGPGADRLQGGAGNDTLDGGAGRDTAVFSGPRADFTLAPSDADFVIRDRIGTGGTDRLQSVERLVFSDWKLALDLNGQAGTVAKLMGVVFGPASLKSPGLVGVALSFADQGLSTTELASLALAEAGANAPQAVVSLLWTNLFGSAPTATQAQPYVDQVNSGQWTLPSLTLFAADSVLNGLNIDLVGLARTGLVYTDGA